MASELCMNCFSVKGRYEVCPFCGYMEGTPPRQPHDLTPGTILNNRFIVGTQIGVGGFGITYKCFDTTLGVTVAVKEFYPAGLVNRAPGTCRVGLLSGDKSAQYQERLQRFMLEAQSVAQFGKAKDIVNVYDFFEENGTAYIIMEYIDGVLLKDYLDKQGILDPETAMNIIMPIIEAVKKIHSKKIIHRDISPDNIFIANESAIKIFDFGAARLNGSEEGMAAEPVIKVGYSPLEQYNDKSSQGFYTDVYAVGAILYQMLTGVKPMESTEREYKDELRSPRELGVKISANMDRAVMEALGVRPELRFQGIGQFEEALLNKRIAEYPKDKIKKRKRTRNWIIGLSASAALAAGSAIALYSTVLKPQNPIFDSEVRPGTEIMVWVENEEQKKQIEELTETGFKTGSGSVKDEKLLKMQEEDEQVTVTVEVHADMEEALQKARESGDAAMPNMFLSDHVTDLDAYALVSMKENVYEALNVEDYLYLEQYANAAGKMEEMPTGLDTLLLYACQIDYDKDNTLEEGSSGFLEKDASIERDAPNWNLELSEIIRGDGGLKNEDGVESEYTFVRQESEGDTLILSNEEGWKQVFRKKTLPNLEMTQYLSAIQTSKRRAKKAFRLNSGRKEKMYGNSIVAGVAYRAAMERATLEEGDPKGANPLNSYQTYVVTHEDKMLVNFSEKYAVTAASTKDQKTACMRMLWVMLSEIGQAKKLTQGETTYPILGSEFEKFPSCNANYKGFVEMVKERHPCVLNVGTEQEAQQFVAGLGKMTKEEEIAAYCEAYVRE